VKRATHRARAGFFLGATLLLSGVDNEAALPGCHRRRHESSCRDLRKRPRPVDGRHARGHDHRRVRGRAYDRKSKIGTLDKALDEATAKGWTVVDMKGDWARVYADDR
jgi:hypothetical protein